MSNQCANGDADKHRQESRDGFGGVWPSYFSRKFSQGRAQITLDEVPSKRDLPKVMRWLDAWSMAYAAFLRDQPCNSVREIEMCIAHPPIAQGPYYEAFRRRVSFLNAINPDIIH